MKMPRHTPKTPKPPSAALTVVSLVVLTLAITAAGLVGAILQNDAIWQ